MVTYPCLVSMLQSGSMDSAEVQKVSQPSYREPTSAHVNYN